jgi:hypothetical protein
MAFFETAIMLLATMMRSGSGGMTAAVFIASFSKKYGLQRVY